MLQWVSRLIAALLLLANIDAQAPSAIVVSVGYLDIAPSSSRSAIPLVKRYRNAARRESGCERFDVLEQVGRPGRFVLLEEWTDRQALDSHLASAPTAQFLDGVKPFAIGAYDQRTYRLIYGSSGPAAVPPHAVYGVMHVDTIPSPQTNGVMLLERLADASRKENGNLRFEILQHVMRPNHFTVVELWRDQKAADAHAVAPHTKQFRDVLLPILGSPYDDRYFKAVE
jgi:quinol monooxygenase YgiN